LDPLKEAARDAPNQIAYLSQDRRFTYQELDAYADQLDLPENTTIPIVNPHTAHFFAAWRRNSCICPLNSRLPAAQIEEQKKRLSTPSSDLLLFTSGSTGTPKIAALSLSNLIASAEGAITHFDLKPNDQWLLSLPLFHVGGIGIMMRCILARATITLIETPDITHLSYVPTQLYRTTPTYKKLRCLLLGGAPIQNIPKKLPIFASYGLTEMGSVVCAKYLPSDEFLGHPLPGREVRIHDGEIQVRGECLFQGYYENGKITPPADWFATGDLGKWCPVNGLAITGRKDWQFISGGENIQPEEIEKHLLTLPNVQEAVVIPKKDPEFGERPIAIIRGSATLEEMRTHLIDKLPKYKIPISLHSVEEMPKNGLKIDRKKLLFNFS
jgi:O-succinylbenzoic acid--CoA ligase